jgi:hypothetical protein
MADQTIRSGKEPYETDLRGDFLGGIGIDSPARDRENSGGQPVNPTDLPVKDSEWGKVTHGK